MSFNITLLSSLGFLYYLVASSWGVYAAFQFLKINKNLKAMGAVPKNDSSVVQRLDTFTWSFTSTLIGAVTVLPVRLILTLIMFIIALIISSILVIWESFYGLDDETLAKLDKNRSAVMAFNWLLGNITYACIYFLGIRVTEMTFDKGGNLSEDDVQRHLASTIISNHVAALDILYFVASMQPGFVAKAAVRSMPFVGSIATVLGTVFVDRSASQSRERTLNSIVDRQNLLKIQVDRNIQQKRANMNLRPIVIFPEGTTSTGAGILSFKRGAFFNKDAVINPVILTYTAPKYNPYIWLPSYDIVDMLLYIPLTLSNLGNVRLTAYWYGSPGIKRNPEETTDHFMIRCERFMRANLEYLRACGKMLGGDHKDLCRYPLPKFVSTAEYLETKERLRARLTANIEYIRRRVEPSRVEVTATRSG